MTGGFNPSCHRRSTLIIPWLSDGSGSKFFDPGRVNFLWLGSGQVRSAIYGLGLNLENFP